MRAPRPLALAQHLTYPVAYCFAYLPAVYWFGADWRFLLAALVGVVCILAGSHVILGARRGVGAIIVQSLALGLTTMGWQVLLALMRAPGHLKAWPLDGTPWPMLFAGGGTAVVALLAQAVGAACLARSGCSPRLDGS